MPRQPARVVRDEPGWAGGTADGKRESDGGNVGSYSRLLRESAKVSYWVRWEELFVSGWPPANHASADSRCHIGGLALFTMSVLSWDVNCLSAYQGIMETSYNC